MRGKNTEVKGKEFQCHQNKDKPQNKVLEQVRYKLKDGSYRVMDNVVAWENEKGELCMHLIEIKDGDAKYNKSQRDKDWELLKSGKIKLDNISCKDKDKIFKGIDTNATININGGHLKRMDKDGKWTITNL